MERDQVPLEADLADSLLGAAQLVAGTEPAPVEALRLNMSPAQVADQRSGQYLCLDRSCFGDRPVTFLNVRLN